MLLERSLVDGGRMAVANASKPDTVVIVTGAARGLGRAMTLALAAAGTRVAAMDLDKSDVEMGKTLAIARERGVDRAILPLQGDVTNPHDCAAVIEETVKRFGAVHGLVNNAGRGMQDIGRVLVGPKTKFFEVDIDTWRGTFDANVNGPFIMAKLLAPRLIAQGWGRIVNIVTSYVTMSWGGGSPYGPTKAALEMATAVWAQDLAGTGVTVNALLPGGAADTRMIPSDEISDRSALVQPEAMGPPIIWLMSAGSDGVTGKRFIAKDWNSQIEPTEAARRVGFRAGW